MRIYSNKLKLHFILRLCFLIIFLSQENVFSEDTLKKSNNFKFSIIADGFILSNLSYPIDPFYHASGLFNSIVTTSIGSNINIPLRLVSEVWNFSNSYESPKNMYLWAKPSINIKIPVSFFYVDSIMFTAGDLGRVRQGQGLSLDYFESQGGTFDIMVAKKINLNLTGIGYGWTGIDDMYLFGISYDSIISMRFLDDLDSENSSRILSADFSIFGNKNLRMYGEAGYNFDQKSKGLLTGLEYMNVFKNGWTNLSFEYRHYDKNFLNLTGKNSYPYFNSLTALDKPLNNFRYYQPKTSNIDALAARVTFKYFLFPRFFVMSDVEMISIGNPQFAYESVIGFEAYEGVNINVGFLNKFFQLYNPFNVESQMFSLHDELWFMLNANYFFEWQF
ncbi:MAG TPA: hypothetical protein PKA90_13485 [Ignavibacteria bacterium]|nr:hypothetical protein [Ignavibacteria bacterium]HMR41432.1 hypothetical protein [Ignavibacteria bacterium]